MSLFPCKPLFLLIIPEHKILRRTSSSSLPTRPPQSGSFGQAGAGGGTRESGAEQRSFVRSIPNDRRRREVDGLGRSSAARPPDTHSTVSAPPKSVSTNSPTAAIGHLKLGDSRLFLDLTLGAPLPNYGYMHMIWAKV